MNISRKLRISVLLGICITASVSIIVPICGYAQNKFFATPNRGIDGAKGNAQIKLLLDENTLRRNEAAANAASITALGAIIDASLTTVIDCGNQGMIGGPEHVTANAQNCLPSLVIDATGETVFNQPLRAQQGLVLGDNPTCDANSEGMLRYVTAQKSVMLCTGTTWIEVGAAPAASGVFTPVTNADLEQVYTSNAVALSGFFGIRTATATNGATIIVNGVSQGSSANVESGNTVALRMTSSATFNTAKSTTLNLSSYSQTWTTTTKPQDTTPNTFSFNNLSNQELDTFVTSNSVTVSGFDGPLTASVSGQGNPQIRVGSGTWGSSVSVNPGQSLQLKTTTSIAYETDVVVTYSVGDLLDTWVIRTKSSCAMSGQKVTSLGSGCTYANDICYYYPDINSTVAIYSNFISPPNSSIHGSFKKRINSCDNRGNHACGNIDTSQYYGWGTTGINGINWSGPSCVFNLPSVNATPGWGMQQACPGPDLFQKTSIAQCYRLVE